MGVEPTSFAWKANIIATIRHPRRGTRIRTENKSSQRTRASRYTIPRIFLNITEKFSKVNPRSLAPEKGA